MYMRKTLTGSIFVTALILVLTLAGCDGLVSNETEYLDNGETFTLEAPANLQAAAYSGVNRISWGAVPNAASYDIYRTEQVTDAGYGIKLGTRTVSSSNNLYWDDVVSTATSAENTLRNGRQYTYTVVANSTIADSTTSVPVWKPSSAGVTVTAKVDPIGTQEPAPAGLAVKPFVASNTDYVLVTWDAVPGRAYTVNYNWGPNPETAPPGSPSAVTTITSPIGSKGSVVAPLFSGNNSITVSAQLTGTNNYFYIPSEKALKAANFEPQTFAWPGSYTVNFSASRVVNTLTGTGNIVQLTWANNSNIAGFKVYRADWNGSTGTFTGDWEEVTATQTLNPGSTQWITFDNNASVDKDYAYILIGINAAGKQTPPTSTTYIATVNDVTLASPAGFSAAVVDGATASPKIDISWTPVAGVTYTLRRALVTYNFSAGAPSPAVTNITSITYDAAPVTTVTATPAAIAAGTQRIRQEGAAISVRQSYRYELVAEKAGLKSNPVYTDVNADPFNRLTNVSLSNTSFNPASPELTLVIGSGSYGNYYQTNQVLVEIWKRKDTDTDYTKVGGSDIQIPSNAIAGTTVPGFHDSLTSGGNYYYKIVTKDSSGELYNLGTTTLSVNVP
jgi:hypothetical protein